jgi:hypothetical protein
MLQGRIYGTFGSIGTALAVGHNEQLPLFTTPCHSAMNLAR